jgi:radical SAM superfamily enzyme YgiQ (UPF0313 family)
LIFTESEELWLDDLYRRAKGIIRHFHIWSVPHLLREDRLDKVEYVQWVQILLGEENGQEELDKRLNNEILTDYVDWYREAREFLASHGLSKRIIKVTLTRKKTPRILITR